MEKRHWQWLGVDHITYAVWDIAFWWSVYINYFGFQEIHHTVDASPGGKSSMELYGLENGNSRIALVRPISRSSTSHVEHFLRLHGDHSVQHVAYAIENLKEFIRDMQEKGIQFLGEVKERADLFGPIKQIFARQFDPNFLPAQGSFYEFVERPAKHTCKDAEISQFFSSEVAQKLYDDLEREQEEITVDRVCFVSGAKIPV